MHPKSQTLLEVHIFMGKTGRKNKNYSPDFKISVIMDMRQNHLSYNETMRRYFPKKKSKDFFFLKKWERIFLEEGAEGLMKERRGRACKESGTRKGRPPKLDKKVEEDLIAENQRLRQLLQDTQMEIDYLKRLSALVLAEERKNGKKR